MPSCSTTWAKIEADLVDPTAGEALLRRAVDERRELFGGDSLEVAESLRKLARVREYLGHHDDAVVIGQQALAILERRGAANRSKEHAPSNGWRSTKPLAPGRRRRRCRCSTRRSAPSSA